MNWTPERPFQALALTGGGYRGLFAARALEVMEAHAGYPIARSFDLICGTSIGGIIALAAAFEVPMAKAVKVFVDEGLEIFPPHQRPSSSAQRFCDLYKHRSRPRYSVGPLRNAITQLIPEETILGDALHPVAIPAVNLTEGKPQVFKTRHHPQWDRDWKQKVVDIALATSAAPTFFQLAEIGDNLYADGGLFANAPDLIALHEGDHFLGVPPDSFRLLSIGTTTEKYSVSYAGGRDFGILDWMSEQRLFNVIISSQQQFVGQLVEHRLGSNYLRIDQTPSHEQIKDLGLDIASKTAKKTLLGLAQKAVTDILSSKLVPYLAHTPQLELIKAT